MSAATRKVIFLAIFFGLHFSAFAQPGDGGGGGDPDVPISGIEVLLGIGGALGARAFWKRKRK